MLVITALFWFATIFILYTFIGYPLLIRLLAKKNQQKHHSNQSPAHWPTIAIIVPVHNEASHIANKIKTLKQINYPKDKVSITFISDGSEDGSNDIISSEPEVTLISYSPRAGKPTALNRGVEGQTADILVFTDARQDIHPDAIQRLVTRLQDPSIGAVSGELVFLDPSTQMGANVGLYWRYEKWIREAESRFNSVAGVTGALYAIRRTSYKPLYPNAILDDFEVPMAILKEGKRIVFEPGAEVYDYPQENSSLEKTRKIRTLTGNFQSFAHNPWLFSPTKNPIWWQFLSHKVFRLLIPYMLLITFFTSLIAPGVFYKLAFVIQLFFYGIGLGAPKLPSPFFDCLSNHKLTVFAKVFIDLNWASVIALKNYLNQQVDIKWQKT